MAIYHTPEEEAELRSLDTKTLAKKNNRHYNGAFIYETVEKKAKHEECYDIIRDELVTRSVLSSVDDKRLIDGSELV